MTDKLKLIPSKVPESLDGPFPMIWIRDGDLHVVFKNEAHVVISQTKDATVAIVTNAGCPLCTQTILDSGEKLIG